MIRPDEAEGGDVTVGWTDPLAKEGIDAGLARTLLEAEGRVSTCEMALRVSWAMGRKWAVPAVSRTIVEGRW